MAEQVVRVGLVGCGSMARCHARNFLAVPEARIVALCDIIPACAEKLAGEMAAMRPAGAPADWQPPKPAIFDDMGRMLAALAGGGLDAVAIVTPHAAHFPQAMAALDAGLHVLVEKPMVTDAGHARTLRDKVRSAGRVFQIAFQGAYTAEHGYARDVVQSGRLGELRMVQGFINQSWMVRVPAHRWRLDPAVSGGGFGYDSGAHLLNAMCWLVNSPVVEVFAMLDRRDTRVDIDLSISIRFANGVIGNAALCGSAGKRATWWTGVTLLGTEGILKLPTHEGRLEHIGADGKEVRYPQVDHPQQFPQDNFIGVILGRRQPRCGVEFGVLLSDLMDALYESARTGRPAKPRFSDAPATRPAT